MLFVYNGTSVPWIISVNNFLIFTNISENMQPTNMYYISLERSLNSASARSYCIKIHTEMAEKMQVKYRAFYIHRCPCIFGRVRNLKFATYLKFATCQNTNKINELW